MGEHSKIKKYLRSIALGLGVGGFLVGVLLQENVREALRPAPPTMLERAKAGEAEAQFQMARHYDHNYEGPDQAEKVLYWYKQSAAQGLYKAYNNLGVLYLEGRYVAKDESKAIEYYKKAAAAFEKSGGNQIVAIRNLAEYYFYEYLDSHKALKWASKGAKYGDGSSYNILGHLYSDNGYGIPQDFDAAVYYYRKAGNAGYPIALLSAGIMYMNADSIYNHYLRAAELFQKAVDMGVDDAYDNLGFVYMHGRGVQKNIDKGISLYKEGIARDNDRARHLLARYYMYIAEPPIKPFEAGKLLQKAKSNGYKTSGEELISNRNYCLKNQGAFSEAFYACQVVAVLEDMEVDKILAEGYFEGKLVDQDIKQAVSYYTRLATKGSFSAQLALFKIYCFGEGEVLPDLVQSYAWANVLIQNPENHPKAERIRRIIKRRITFLKAQMTRSEQRKAHNLAQKYMSGGGVPL